MLQGNTYDLMPVRSPRLHGAALRLLVPLLEQPAIASLLAPRILRNLGVLDLRAADIKQSPTFLPLYAAANDSTARGHCPDVVPMRSRCGVGFHFHSIRDYQHAFQNRTVTPDQIAERVFAAIMASDDMPKPLRAFIAWDRENILSQACEATRRYRQSRPLGTLDGIPIAVKDEVDVVPYPTTAGTRFLCSAAQTDSTVVARLRSAGALLIGKTNMHEIGILPDGWNPHHGVVRNPYNPVHETGGSSSGSAAAVASGLCPGAIGADGGGSIRVPASFCGVIGLKPTFGRVSEFGAVPLAWSVAHLGPIAATAEDAALLYATIAGQDPADPNTQSQPAVRIDEYDGRLNGVRVGIYGRWFSDAEGPIVAACEQALANLARLGAELVDVAIPDLRRMATAHGLTIHTEMAANMDRYDRHRGEFGWTTRMMLATVRTVPSSDYVQAQRMRTRAIRHFLSELMKADVIAMPTTPVTAPEISEKALPHGEVDLGQAIRIMQFVNPANFTGLPAISIPVGYDHRSLPIGLQLIARPWDENLLFRLAYALEPTLERRRPTVYFDLLPELGGSG